MQTTKVQISLRIQKFKTLASFGNWAGQSEPYLVTHPKDSFFFLRCCSYGTIATTSAIFSIKWQVMYVSSLIGETNQYFGLPIKHFHTNEISQNIDHSQLMGSSNQVCMKIKILSKSLFFLKNVHVISYKCVWRMTKGFSKRQSSTFPNFLCLPLIFPFQRAQPPYSRCLGWP